MSRRDGVNAPISGDDDQIESASSFRLSPVPEHDSIPLEEVLGGRPELPSSAGQSLEVTASIAPAQQPAPLPVTYHPDAAGPAAQRAPRPAPVQTQPAIMTEPQPVAPPNSRAATPVPEPQNPPAAPAVQETGSANNALSDDDFFAIANTLRDNWNAQQNKRVELDVATSESDAIKRTGNTVEMFFTAKVTIPATMQGQSSKTENTKITLSRTNGVDGKVERRIDCATALSIEEQFALLAKAAFLEHKQARKELKIDVSLKNPGGAAQSGQLTPDEQKLVKAYLDAGFDEVYCQGKKFNGNSSRVQESAAPTGVVPAVVGANRTEPQPSQPPASPIPGRG